MAVKKKRPVKQQVSADELFKSYMSKNSRYGPSDVQERKGLLQAIVRNVLVGNGRLSNSADLQTVIGDVYFSMLAWSTWYSEFSPFFSENADYELSEQGRAIIVAMAQRSDNVPKTHLFTVVEKAVIFLKVFPEVVDVFREKVLSGSVPANRRILAYLGVLDKLDAAGCLAIRPFDLDITLELLKIGRKKLHKDLPDIISGVAAYGRAMLADGSKTLCAILSCGLPSAVVSQIRKNCIAPSLIPESIFHKAVLESTITDKRGRATALRYFIGTTSLSEKIRLQVRTALPDELFGKELSQMLVFLGECIENHDMLDGIPDSAIFKTRAVDLLLSGESSGKELFKEAQEALRQMSCGAEEGMRFVA